jgi:hypothetical protein
MRTTRKSLVTFAVAAAFAAVAAFGEEECPREQTDLLKTAKAVVLARVVESTFDRLRPHEHWTEEELEHFVAPKAKVLVLLSWKGPFAAGNHLNVGNWPVLMGGCCLITTMPVGKEYVFLFERLGTDPLGLWEQQAIDSSEATCLMTLLDRMKADDNAPQ